MSKLDQIIEIYPDESFLKADGYDDAIIGVTTNKTSGVLLLVYSKTLCIEIMIDEMGMEYEDAVEHYYFNVEGSYVGEQTPIFVEDEFYEE